MTTTNWTVSIGATDFTSSVLSLALNIGRQTFFDDWNGGDITITLRNQNGQCSNIKQFDVIETQAFVYFYVTNIAFNDQIAVDGATCTVTGIDPIRTLSQYYWDTATTSSLPALDYIYDTFSATVIGPPYMDPPGSSYTKTNASGAASQGTSTLLNFFSSILMGECGAITSSGPTIIPKSLGSPISSSWDFVRTGGTGITYYDIQRLSGTALSANQVTVSNQLVDSVFNNTDPVNFRRNYTRYTQVLTSTAEQQARFFAIVLSDPANISGNLSWLDRAQDSAINASWYSTYANLPGKFATLQYQPPGGSLTTILVKIEGVSCQATPQQTNWTVNFTDANLFGFILNSTTNGVLNTDRLGW